jgi:hypothetical protein
MARPVVTKSESRKLEGGRRREPQVPLDAAAVPIFRYRGSFPQLRSLPSSGLARSAPLLRACILLSCQRSISSATQADARPPILTGAGNSPFLIAAYTLLFDNPVFADTAGRLMKRVSAAVDMEAFFD